MSFYKELVDNPGQVVSEQVAHMSQEQVFPSFVPDTVYLCMGGFKYLYASPIWEAVYPDKLQRYNGSGEDKGWYGKPEITAASKIVDLKEPILSEGKSTGEVLAVGQDGMVCDELGRPIDKPDRNANKEDIFDSMKESLGRKRQFRLKSGLAILKPKNGEQSKGTMLATEQRFSITPFSSAELELYTYGLAGQDGSYPEYLRQELDVLIEQGWITEEEQDYYAKGMSLEELKQTNGGFRWPHPIFIRHINQIDGINMAEGQFAMKRQELFLSLLGAMPEVMTYSDQIISSLQREEERTWVRLVKLRDGSLASLETLDLADRNAIVQASELIQTNFKHHPHYRDLSTRAREEFLEVNTLEQLLDACYRSDSIAGYTILQNGEMLGFCLLRFRDTDTAEIRRLHTRYNMNGLGIGTMLVEEAIAAAKNCGCTKIAAASSGESDDFFLKMGFNGNGRTANDKLRKRGIKTPVNYCVRYI